MKEFSIRRRIGIISSAAAFSVVILNLVMRSAIPRMSFVSIVTHPNVWLFLMIGVLSAFSIRINHVFFRILQVFLFFAYGIFAIIWNKSEDLTGQIFIVIGV